MLGCFPNFHWNRDTLHVAAAAATARYGGREVAITLGHIAGRAASLLGLVFLGR